MNPIFVALDTQDVHRAAAIARDVSGLAAGVKLGLEFFCANGHDGVLRIAEHETPIFLDLKLHDIPNTVERATRQIARLGASFLTVHAYPQTMKAGLAGAAGSSLKLLGVTVLTSCDDADLVAAGYAHNVKDLVARRAVQAKECGMGGLVMSPEEVESIRALVGP